jgi:ribose transport system substrate-binding protein
MSCAVFAVVLALGVVACGGSGSSSSGSDQGGGEKVSIDVGTGKPVEVEGKPKIAMLWTSGNLFQEAFKKAAEEEAKNLGVEMTVFDSKFDPETQLEQTQDVLQRGGYNAMIVLPLDGNTMCPILTEQAPAKNIAVVTAVVPMCNRAGKPEGEPMWSPGTVSQVGFAGTINAEKFMFEEVGKRVGTGHHIGALFLGPPLIAGAISSKQAMEEVQEAGTLGNLDVEYMINTDFTTPDGFAKAQTLLQAHPDVDTIISTYSDLTVGIIRAIDQAGLQGKVKVYDQGASGQSLEAIRDGELQFTTGDFPATYGKESVQAVVEAFEGKKPKRWHGAYVQGSKFGEPVVIDKANIDTFEPEY